MRHTAPDHPLCIALISEHASPLATPGGVAIVPKIMVLPLQEPTWP